MLDSLLAAMALIADGHIALTALTGICLGLLFGVLPGLSGLTTLAIAMPFIYGMEPMMGLSFLLAAHASVYTGGAVTAILLGIPGAPANAATVIDGFALQQKGQGSYAIGAALAASGLGGIVSAGVLALALPVLQPFVMAFGSPEIFLLALIGIVSVAVLGQGEPVKGLAAAGLGLFFSVFGYHRITGVPRFWMGSEYLLDGIRLIPLVLGLFAVPEIASLAREGSQENRKKNAIINTCDLWRGAMAVIRRPVLFIKSVLIGILVGMIPGVGGETAPFLAYAASKNTTGEVVSEPGRIEGVIAPESSNNAKEGGALVPTLALGIPGSAAMTLLLGGFLIMGLEPGPDFLESHLDLAIALAIILAVTNLVAALLMAPLSVFVARLAGIRGQLLAPVLLVLIVFGAYSSDKNTMDVLLVFIFGILGLMMKHLNYSRPALILGFILGPIIETYLYISLTAYGLHFLFRPISFTLAILLITALVWGFLKKSNLFGTGDLQP